MKSIVLSGVVTALLIFSGCTKNPDANGSGANAGMHDNSNAQEVNAPANEIVPMQDNIIQSASDSMENLEGRLGSVYFEFDQFNVSSDMQSKITNDSDAAKTAVVKYNIKLEGNCDEWGSDEYNFALGLKRSNSVKQALIAQGVDAGKITMVSYGESNPSCKEKTQACWAKNRRVDFTLLP